MHRAIGGHTQCQYWTSRSKYIGPYGVIRDVSTGQRVARPVVPEFAEQTHRTITRDATRAPSTSVSTLPFTWYQQSLRQDRTPIANAKDKRVLAQGRSPPLQFSKLAAASPWSAPDMA
eukprot:2449374-Rhodomonas_salina.2